MKPTRNIVKVNKGLWTPKHAVWFKKNDDGDDDEENVERFKRIKKMQRENNKLAKELGYPRGVKQMKEEGAI